MAARYEDVAAKARELSHEDQLRLIDELHAVVEEDLEGEVFPELSPEWKAVIQRRVEEIRSGAVETIPMDEAFRIVRERLKR